MLIGLLFEVFLATYVIFFFFWVGGWVGVAGHGTPLEHLAMSLVMGAPIAGATLMGFGSVGLVYGYILFFDFMRCMGHSNVEVFPHGMFNALPFLRYLVYTPT